MVSRMVSRVVSRMVSRVVSRMVSRVVSRMVSRVVSRMVSRVVSRMVSRVVSRVVSRMVSRVVIRMVSRVVSRVVSSESVRIDKQSEINSIIRSYFTASGKATGKVRYYFRVNADQPILQRFALRRAARMLRSQQGANPKGLSDVGTSEN